MCENPSVRWQICECLTLLILLRLTTAAPAGGVLRFWSMPGVELDEHHMLWCLNSLDSASCAVRWAMWQEKYADLGMDVKVTICSWNTKEIRVWAWMQWEPYALGTRRQLWFWAWMQS